MPGANASNLHIGSRSEMLADYFFGTFGPVTPVRGHDDYGLDLYCALSERVGQRSIVRESFSVQVKSTADGWSFESPEEIRWLLEQTNPVLLCVVDKNAGTVEVFHTFARFDVEAHSVPHRLVLKPGTGSEGCGVGRPAPDERDLSAPIIRASVTEFYDEERHEVFRCVLASWLAFDRLNIDNRRAGIMRYRMPGLYTTNEPTTPGSGVAEVGKLVPDRRLVNLAIRRLCEAADCVGDQLRQLRDMQTAMRAALLVDHLRSTYPDALDEFSRHRPLGHLMADILKRLGPGNLNEGLAALDALQVYLNEHPGVASAIAAARTEDSDAFKPL